MATETAECFAIDPELPRRAQYDSTQEASDNSLVDLVQAVQSTTKELGLQKSAVQSPPRMESRKRKRSISQTSDDEGISRSKRPSKQSAPNGAQILGELPSNQNITVDPSSALFRKQSQRTHAKKYTRPPTKDVFQSLKIMTEEWVQLEAKAKAFMLDEAFPERQASVGNRGSAPTNDTKIQLFKTVQKFLAEGAGRNWFGRKDKEDRWEYPRDEDKLIALLTPLMRRMVTNERQRQYARRTRMSGSGARSAEPEGKHAQNSHSPFGSRSSPHIDPKSTVPSISNEPQLQTSEQPFAENTVDMIFLLNNQITHRHTIPQSSYTITLSHTDLLSTIRTHLLQNEQARLISNATATDLPISPPEDLIVDEEVRHAREVYRAALQKAAMAAAAQVLPRFEVEAHTGTGLVRIDGEGAWDDVRKEVGGCEWMTGYLRVLVRVCDG